LAVERGPLVLCLESTDIPDAELEDLRLLPDPSPRKSESGAVVTLERLRAPDAAPAWPYGVAAAWNAPAQIEVELQPYFHWANRGPSTMRVWIPTASS
ncbi:MAG TPA: glycoside hydrolase family 127 protein, partial [Leifsonia sp.]|nr:glycoside hydrolase family 127 protein [Leifsonia sp.]